MRETATSRSKTIQNELIECCGEYIVEQLVAEIKDAAVFSVLADEVADISNKEQMPIIIRYVDKTGEIREKLVRFVHLEKGTKGEYIADAIKNELNELGLDLVKCRGQRYDGAGNMSGKCIGATKLILTEFPQAIYIHCASHRLNLCVANACKIQIVKNLFSKIKSVHDFFNWPKRRKVLQDTIMEICPKETRTELRDVCRTRWIERIEALEAFEKLYVPIVSALEKIQNNFDDSWLSEYVTEANGLWATCIQFEFIGAILHRP